MHLPAPSLPPGQPDPKWLRRTLFVQWGCLALVLSVSMTAVSAWLFPQVGNSLPVLARHLDVPIALAAMFCAFSLVWSEAGNPLLELRIGKVVALLPIFVAMAILITSLVSFPGVAEIFQTPGQAVATGARLSPLSTTVFLYLCVVMVLVLNENKFLQRAADLVVLSLCLVMLVLVSQDIFEAFGLFGLTASELISPQVLCYMVLLTTVIALRHAQFGVLSIFLGSGIGSRIARGFAPILMVWPFVREIGETQIVFRQLIPAHFAASVLSSLAVAFSLLFLLFLVWRINGMEQEIHDLTLRDELTGLYNMRGFYLLAEQTLRLAQRAQLPFSVLFLDLDGLKQINDRQGHSTGSTYLAETGQLIFDNFREGDVKGRFGGDEFVVAGQFSVVGIEVATQRLKASAAKRSKEAGRRFPLSFSIGHVTSEYYSMETLKELVARADQAMYEEKRRKKVARK